MAHAVPGLRRRSIAVAPVCWHFFRRHLGGALRLGPPMLRLVGVSVLLLVTVLALFLIADEFRWPTWGTAIGSAAPRGGEPARPRHRDHLRRYIAILWNLWFYSFWSVEIVREATESSLLAAALTAAFNAGAGIIGFPVGGWLADSALRRGVGRKPLLISFSVIYSLLVFTFALSISGDGEPSLVLLA